MSLNTINTALRKVCKPPLIISRFLYTKYLRETMQCFRIFVLQKFFFIGVKLFRVNFDYIFLVYPGIASDMDKFTPRWFAKSANHRTRIIVCGIITKPNNNIIGRGLVIAVPSTVKSMLRHKDDCLNIKNEVLSLAKKLSVKTVSIAGRGMSIFLRHNIPMNAPFVEGSKGMVFCTKTALQSVMQKHSMIEQHTNIVIFGAGRVGMNIYQFLQKKEFLNISIITTRDISNINAPQIRTPSLGLLNNADIIINISPKGSDIYPYIPDMKSEALILDDTHPRMMEIFLNIFIYRAALGLPGLKFIPPLSKYTPYATPGCVVESMVCAKYGMIVTQKEFNKKASSFGFYAYGIDR